ncbi:Hypothetical predicted protein [Olea europaea subsp. europaea]|uniref:Uncharacterized protein n=1 Tax=Olea europaea subsp. europaea TaxID=158383 RepID=A0A8S0V9W3_OLEEU|nr:Hypothetical predicted protein [Olea europaea subsp. europaea]
MESTTSPHLNMHGVTSKGQVDISKISSPKTPSLSESKLRGKLKHKVWIPAYEGSASSLPSRNRKDFGSIVCS